MGGLLYTLGLYPFMYHGIIGSETDFNTITKMGLYKIHDGLNAPNGPEIDHGILIYFVSSDNHYKLMLVARTSGTLKFRTGDSKWRDWKVLFQ